MLFPSATLANGRTGGAGELTLYSPPRPVTTQRGKSRLRHIEDIGKRARHRKRLRIRCVFGRRRHVGPCRRIGAGADPRLLQHKASIYGAACPAPTAAGSALSGLPSLKQNSTRASWVEPQKEQIFIAGNT